MHRIRNNQNLRNLKYLVFVPKFEKQSSDYTIFPSRLHQTESLDLQIVEIGDCSIYK